MITRWRCTECNHICHVEDLLRAVSPFDAHNDITGCPECRAIEKAEPVCDVDGCDELVSSGWTSDEGYRHTCHKHSESAMRAKERGE